MAFTTPLIRFSTAIAADQNVVVDTTYIQSIDKLTIPVGSAVNIQNGTMTYQYGILFTIVEPDSFTKNVLIRFSSDTIRNTAFTALFTAGVTDLMA